MKKIIMQKQYTFNEALIKSFGLHRNGCNYRMRFTANRRILIEYGCLGVFPALITGVRKRFYRWFEQRQIEGYCDITDYLDHETKFHLLKLNPCECCGGTLFERRDKNPKLFDLIVKLKKRNEQLDAGIDYED